ncbi:MAG: WXG100 family type VII secretion target [Pseudonocardiaceae bacterium]
MNTPDGQIKVTFGAIATAVSDTGTTAQQMNQQLDDLKQYLGPLVSSWTGQAATDYNALQAKWHTSAANLTQILQQISATLQTSHDNYNAAEQANSNIWAG